MPRLRLNMKFYDIAVGQHKIVFYALSLMFPCSPDFGILELMGKILVKFKGRILNGTSERKDYRVGEIDFVPNPFGVNPNHTQ